MAPLLETLGRRRWLHNLVGMLRVHAAIDVLLRRFPLERHLEPSGIAYRLTSLDQFSIEYGMFDFEEYALALVGRPTRTFIDLGCNAGWFALWLASRSPGLPSRGLLVDAHPRMAAEAVWHMNRNRLQDCVVVHGAVGLPEGESSTDFHLHPSTSASSVLPPKPGKQLPIKGKITTVSVPAISVANEWQKHFGDAIVDVLKIDIEGKELDFVDKESAFLQSSVRRIVLEWHGWWVTLPQLDMRLSSIGFRRDGVYNEAATLGLASYENSATVT